MVDPTVLQDAGSAFGQTADSLAGLQPDAPLGTAAAGVPQLATAAACRAAQTTILAEAISAADAARRYGDSLGTAASQYTSQDQGAARAVEAAATPWRRR
jgi:hypothetical protein